MVVGNWRERMKAPGEFPVGTLRGRCCKVSKEEVRGVDVIQASWCDK